MTTDLTPSDWPQPIQNFLYACAFWILAADEELSTIEQEWLLSSFGSDMHQRSLNKLLSLQEGSFLPAFDGLVSALSESDKRDIYPLLTPWLCQCVTVDGQFRPAENEVLQEIKKRIQIEAELSRLATTPPPLPDTKQTETELTESPPLPERESPSISEEPIPEQPTFIPPTPTNTVEEILEEESTPSPLPSPAPQAPPPTPVQTRTDETFLALQGHDAEITALSTDATGRYVFTGDKNGALRLWDMKTNECISVLEYHKKEIAGTVFHPNNHTAVSADNTGKVIAWNLESGAPLWTSELKALGGLSGLAVNPDGTQVALCSSGCKIATLNWATGETIRVTRQKGWPAFRCISYHPNGQALALGGDDKQVHLLDAASLETMRTFSGHTSTVLATVFADNGAGLVTGARDNTVRIWETDSGQPTRTLEGHTFSVYGVAINSESSRLLSASWDHTAKLWDLQTGALLLNIENPDGGFNAAAFLAHSNRAALACSDGQLYILSGET